MDAPTTRFWSHAFAGATPPVALGVALNEGILDRRAFEDHGNEWVHAWLQGTVARMTDAYDLRHRPWRAFGGAGRSQHMPMERAPRLADLAPGVYVDHATDAGLLSVFQGFHHLGWNLDAPLVGIEWARTLREAAVALHLPCALDWMASLDDGLRRALATGLAPPGLLSERSALPWLHAAARAWHESTVAALLDAGADPDQRDIKGQTALFHARTERTVQRLLDAGADPMIEDQHGRTALQAWGQVKDFPWGVDAKKLSALAQKVTPVSAAAAAGQAVLYVADAKGVPFNPTPEAMATWAARIPDVGGPLHTARMNPGGSWKGEWSPAAWLGLGLLRTEVGTARHLPALLARPDFLSPDPVYPKGKLSERGLMGLALLEIIANAPAHKPHEKASGFEHERWAVAHAASATLGDDWARKPEWQGPMRETTRALLAPKGTSMTVREAVQGAWRRGFERHLVAGKDDAASALWEARAQGGLRFEHRDWRQVFARLPDGLEATFLLLALADGAAAHVRERSWQSADEARLDYFAYGDGAQDATRLARLWKERPGLPRLSPALDADLEDAITLALDVPMLAQGCADLRARRLDQALPAAPARGRGPRL